MLELKYAIVNLSVSDCEVVHSTQIMYKYRDMYTYRGLIGVHLNDSGAAELTIPVLV